MWLFATVAWAGEFDEAALRAKIADTAALRAQRQTDSPPPLPDDAYTTAAGGDVATGLISHEGIGARQAWGLAVLDVDIGRLWAAINDETHHVGWSQIGYSELLTGQICESGRHVLQFLPITLASDRWWVTVITDNDALVKSSGGAVREVSWQANTDESELITATAKAKAAEGIPIGWSKGGWFLVALDDTHTLVEYDVWSDPGGSIPASTASWFASGQIPDLLDAMRRYATEGSPKCSR